MNERRAALRAAAGPRKDGAARHLPSVGRLPRDVEFPAAPKIQFSVVAAFHTAPVVGAPPIPAPKAGAGLRRRTSAPNHAPGHRRAAEPACRRRRRRLPFRGRAQRSGPAQMQRATGLGPIVAKGRQVLANRVFRRPGLGCQARPPSGSPRAAVPFSVGDETEIPPGGIASRHPPHPPPGKSIPAVGPPQVGGVVKVFPCQRLPVVPFPSRPRSRAVAPPQGPGPLRGPEGHAAGCRRA